MDPPITTGGGWHEFQPGRNQQEHHSSSSLPRGGDNAGSSRSSSSTIALASARGGGELLSLSDELFVTPPTMPSYLIPSALKTTPIGRQRGSVFKMPPPRRHSVAAETAPRKTEEESLTSSFASSSTFSSRLVPLTILSRYGMVTRSMASLSPPAVVAFPSSLSTSTVKTSSMNLLPKIALTPKGGLTETVDSVIDGHDHENRADHLPEFHSEVERSQSSSTGGHKFFDRVESDNTEIVALHLWSPPNVHDDDDSPITRPMPSITFHHLDIIERPILLSSPHSKSSPSFLRPIKSHKKLQIRCRSLFDSTTKNDPIEHILHADAIAEAAKSNDSLTDDDGSEFNEYHPDFHLGMPTTTAATKTNSSERIKIPFQPRSVAYDKHKSPLNNSPPLSVGLSKSKSVEQGSHEDLFDHNETLSSSVHCRPLSTTSLCGLNIVQTTTTTPPPSITTYDSSKYYPNCPSIRQPSFQSSSYNSLNSLGFSIDGG